MWDSVSPKEVLKRCFGKLHTAHRAQIVADGAAKDKKLLTGRVNVSWLRFNSVGSCRGAFGRHNRSGELWSPLVALAAFFEEQGQVTGLRQAIATAAENDEQISQGKALSEREEAVLQALELLTRGQTSVVWIKAAALREKVARLLGQPVEKRGESQWIGHIIKRLHLLDEAGRKRGMDGITYAVKPLDVIDMMRRYDVAVIYENR